MKKWQAWRWQSQTGLKLLSILSFSFMTRFIVNDKFYFNSLWLFLILFSLVLYSASMINCMYKLHLELLYSKNKTKNKNNRVTDNQSTCLQNLLLTHLVYVIKVSRIIKSYYVMHLVLEIARRLLHSAVHLYGYARFCIKEQTKDSLIDYKI